MFENSVQEYYLQRVKKVYSDRKKRLGTVKTRKQALAYVEDVRKKIAKSFNLPKTKCPLNVKITKEQKINGITVKNVVYESRRDYPVTALLMLPEGAGKHPASIFLCGHAEDFSNGSVSRSFIIKARLLFAASYEHCNNHDQCKQECQSFLEHNDLLCLNFFMLPY